MAKQKPAYLVASSSTPEGHGSLDAYGKAADPLQDQDGGELLVAGSPLQFLGHYEGDWNEGARFTLIRFPSPEALQGFWHSAEYQSIKHLRTDVTPPSSTFAVEGFDPDAWAEQHPGARLQPGVDPPPGSRAGASRDRGSVCESSRAGAARASRR